MMDGKVDSRVDETIDGMKDLSDGRVFCKMGYGW